MSKPIARVVFSALIALALIVGIYTSVLAGAKSGQTHVSAGVNLVPNRDRTTVDELQSLGAQSEPSNQPGHDCHNESWIDPDD